MAHVVVEPCFGCKYTDCVVVCPVECFYEGEQMVYIHPDECIDCEACVPECPVEAIFHEDNVPKHWSEYLELNATMAMQSPVITEKANPLAGSVQLVKKRKTASASRKKKTPQDAASKKSDKSTIVRTGIGNKQGFQFNQQDKKAIELLAMKRATEFFREKGCKVTDVSNTQPYDLLCENKQRCWYVEVKGTTGLGEKVILTRKEVEFARKNRDQMALFIFKEIEFSRKRNGELKVHQAVQQCIDPWNIDSDGLKPIQYKYDVPK